MNKRSLYESIMKNVAKEVKKALNENHFGDIDTGPLQSGLTVYVICDNPKTMKDYEAERFIDYIVDDSLDLKFGVCLLDTLHDSDQLAMVNQKNCYDQIMDLIADGKYYNNKNAFEDYYLGFTIALSNFAPFLRNVVFLYHKNDDIQYDTNKIIKAFNMHNPRVKVTVKAI